MKTIEEAAKGLPENKGYVMSSTTQMLEVAFKSGVEFAQRWIPVEELPEQGCYVIVKFLETGYYGHHWCSANYYQASKTFEVHNKELSNFHITHWRPIELK